MTKPRAPIVDARSIMDTFMDGFWLLNAHGQIIEANETYCRMTGYSLPELLTMHVSDFEVLETPEDTAARIEKIQAQGVDRFESKHRRKDGSVFDVDVSVLYQTDESGCMVVFIRDITERIRAEYFLRLIINNIPDFVFWKDRNSIYLGCNNAFAEAAGVGSPDQIVGKSDFDLEWKDSDAAFYVSIDQRVMQSGQPVYHLIEPQLQASGKQAWLETCKVPLHDDQGQVIGILGTYMDITERARAEQRLKESETQLRLLNAHLEERVAERTAQLQVANKELEAFAFSVSHDLRAPLRAIDGYSKILLDDYAPRLDDEAKRVCSVISQSARDMGKLIDDLLAFSRIGRAAMQISNIDMETLARSIFFEVTTPAERERIDFQVGSLPGVTADPPLLCQLWRNLLSNAVKFSAKKARAVIDVSHEVIDGESVYLIRDNGAGFDQQFADKLFGVFQRLHSNRDFEGTGVGLAIVQRIIERHGGRIWAEGQVDHGATFYFTFHHQSKP